MQKAVKISQRLTACLPDETAHSQASPAACPPVPEPMQLDSNRLTRTERARRLATGLCLYCRASGHFIQKCPSCPPRSAVSTLQVEPDISILPLLIVQLLTPHHSISVSALIDSGSLGNFISQNLLRRLNLPRKRQAQELKIETFQAKPLGPALITGPSILTQSNSPIHFLWSRPRSRNSVVFASSRSWTCGVSTTLFVSRRATSGRLDS